MKFLDESDIELINQFLNFDTSDCHITGGCDLFTTKPVGADRKLYKTIDKQFDALIEQSGGESTNQQQTNEDVNNNEDEVINNEFIQTRRRFSTSDYHNNININNTTNDQSLSTSPEVSPFGPLNQITSRRTFAYLIGILNSSFPDNDFSSLQPSNFIKTSFQSLKSKFENTLLSLGKQNFEFIWNIINAQIDLKNSTFYQLSIDEPLDLLDEDEETSKTNLWQFKWFIFNKKRKRVAFLYLNGFRLLSPKLQPSKNRRLTIDNDLDNEEYDLAYDDKDQYKSVFEDDDEGEDDGYGEIEGYEDEGEIEDSYPKNKELKISS